MKSTLHRPQSRHAQNKTKTRHTRRQNKTKTRHTRRQNETKTRHTRREKRKMQCSPLGRQDRSQLPTCYTDEHLRVLQEMWNARHPDAPIRATAPKDILHALQRAYKGTCRSERCWIHQMSGKRTPRKQLIDAFRPNAPASWSENPNQWVSSTDITNVMRQYEARYKCFDFIGPSPIDYDAKTVSTSGFNTTYVWPELRDFSVATYANQGKYKIGIIFNLDIHTGKGSHWVAMFINIRKKQIAYFDSTGYPIPTRLKRFVETIQKQHPEFTFWQNSPNIHQRGDTECGVYVLYFIIKMLEDKISLEFLKTNSLSDQYISQFRKKYFN